VANYNYESLSKLVSSTMLTESVNLPRHINSKTTSKCHLYCNLLMDFVYLVDGKRVQEMICNYNTTWSDS
jgi:hypothetical protein